MLYLDFDRLIKEVLGSGGQVSFKRHYKLDVEKYAWVADFVKDQKLRKSDSTKGGPLSPLLHCSVFVGWEVEIVRNA